MRVLRDLTPLSKVQIGPRVGSRYVRGILSRRALLRKARFFFERDLSSRRAPFAEQKKDHFAWGKQASVVSISPASAPSGGGGGGGGGGGDAAPRSDSASHGADTRPCSDRAPAQASCALEPAQPSSAHFEPAPFSSSPSTAPSLSPPAAAREAFSEQVAREPGDYTSQLARLEELLREVSKMARGPNIVRGLDLATERVGGFRRPTTVSIEDSTLGV